ncbi:MAG: class I SAM-dependent methyltransferase [Pyrinomonadaceae bacterium]
MPAPPPARDKRLLEIGCASGAFLHRMAGEGLASFRRRIFRGGCRAGRALWATRFTPVRLKPTPAPASSAERYDLIAGWMVLEHLHDPVSALRQLHAWAKPGARLALSVPNANSLEFSVFRDAWFALQLPNSFVSLHAAHVKRSA